MLSKIYFFENSRAPARSALARPPDGRGRSALAGRRAGEGARSRTHRRRAGDVRRRVKALEGEARDAAGRAERQHRGHLPARRLERGRGQQGPHKHQRIFRKHRQQCSRIHAPWRARGCEARPGATRTGRVRIDGHRCVRIDACLMCAPLGDTRRTASRSAPTGIPSMAQSPQPGRTPAATCQGDRHVPVKLPKNGADIQTNGGRSCRPAAEARGARRCDAARAHRGPRSAVGRAPHSADMEGRPHIGLCAALPSAAELLHNKALHATSTQ